MPSRQCGVCGGELDAGGCPCLVRPYVSTRTEEPEPPPDPDHHVSTLPGPVIVPSVVDTAAVFPDLDPPDQPPPPEPPKGLWGHLPGIGKTAIAAGCALLLFAVGAATSRNWGPHNDRYAQMGNGTATAHVTPTPSAPSAPASDTAPSGSASASASASPSKKPSPRPTKPAPPPPPKHHAPNPVTYQSWVGPGCPRRAGGGYEEWGRYWDGREGWYTVTTGGYNGGGCDGSFTSVPMSGSATEDHDNRVVWWWSVGERSQRCAISVHIPDSYDYRDVAGDPTRYDVLQNPQDRDTTYGGFEIDQVDNRGRTVDVGTWPVEDGRIAVKLLDRGQDWYDDHATLAHHAAAQIRVTCRA
ncbi:hypothetical protein [Wenjunlia tyrosinilytica]|uniref:Adhesin n=1 Tax=Wenjunlia tyrosinilytica TaxID=1544741 RepID=A0A917ZRL6_9ACTN|nr:hypothetical protein [Wenjunlia tyrosinilytica]GGO88609.1 hypothetical protein GCM10012280_29840 [Wenjunlia tyrosinilytica]